MTRRGVVYEYIRAHPGAHVRGIAKVLHLATGDLQYHIFWLEKHGFVKTRRSGFYRFVYPAMVFQEGQEVLLGVLTQETQREILLCLLHDPTITQGGLARSLGHSQPTISWHLERLMQTGLVGKKRTSGGMVYQVVADPDDIVSFVKSYHPSVWKRWADRLKTAAASKEGRRGVAGMPIRRAGLMPAAVVKLIGNG
jgi:predicted transcriptional regulator